MMMMMMMMMLMMMMDGHDDDDDEEEEEEEEEEKRRRRRIRRRRRRRRRIKIRSDHMYSLISLVLLSLLLSNFWAHPYVKSKFVIFSRTAVPSVNLT